MPQALFPLNLMCTHADCFSKIQIPGAWESSRSSVHSRLPRRRCLAEMTVRQGLLKPLYPLRISTSLPWPSQGHKVLGHEHYNAHCR